MILDVARVGHAIAIGENDVIPGRCDDGFVKDNGLAETAVLMPDVLDGERLGLCPGSNQDSRGLC